MYNGKYVELYNSLKRKESVTTSVTLTISEIEAILSFTLPASAYKYSAWWENEYEGNHAQARSWRYAGWKTSNVKVGTEITFVRET